MKKGAKKGRKVTNGKKKPKMGQRKCYPQIRSHTTEGEKERKKERVRGVIWQNHPVRGRIKRNGGGWNASFFPRGPS